MPRALNLLHWSSNRRNHIYISRLLKSKEGVKVVRERLNTTIWEEGGKSPPGKSRESARTDFVPIRAKCAPKRPKPLRLLVRGQHHKI